MNKFIEGNILKTAAEVLRTGIGTPVLIDSKEDAEKLAEEDSVPTEGFEYFDTTDAKFVDAFAEDYIAKNEGKRSYRNDGWCMGFSCYDSVWLSAEPQTCRHLFVSKNLETVLQMDTE